MPISEISDISLGEQKARWRKMARDALLRWHLHDAALSWLGYSSNAVFAVAAADGRFVLRLQWGERVKSAGLRAELRWLRRIRRHTPLLAPLAIAPRASAEAYFVELPHEALPAQQTVYATLFEFLPGETKTASELGLDDIRSVGRYLAYLHRDAQPGAAAGFERPRLDWPGLFGVDSPYGSAGEDDQLDASQRAVFAEVGARVRDVMSELDCVDGAFGLIHADLLAKNIKFNGADVAALDFEHCGWGYFLYDLAPLLWQLKGERAADYPALEGALWSAYIDIRPAAAHQRHHLEAMIAARQLVSCRWLMQHLHHPAIRAQAPKLLRERCAELQGYLETGELGRASMTL